MGLAHWQHHFKAIMQRHLFDIATSEEDGQVNLAADMLFGHTSHIGTALYAVDLSEWTLTSSTVAAKFISASQDCHAWLLSPLSQYAAGTSLPVPAQPSDGAQHVPSATCAHPSTSPPQSSSMSISQVKQLLQESEAWFAEQVREITTNAVQTALQSFIGATGVLKQASTSTALQQPGYIHLQALQHFLNDEAAHFHSPFQGTALATIMSWLVNILAVLPTGSGKTALYRAPAKVEPLVTEVVSPLVALKMDLQKQAAEADVIVIEEPHLLLTQKHFHPLCDALKNLGKIGASIVLTTATLSPEAEAHLKEALGIVTLSTVCMSTQWPEIQYHAIQYATNQEIKASVHHANTYIPQLAPGETILMQCCEKTLAIDLAASMGVPVFHADLTTGDKEYILSHWLKGEFSCLVATGALGAGVHHPHVHVVIHVGIPYGAAEFLQESDQGGCNRKPALSLILWSKPFPPANAEIDFSGYQALKEMLDDGIGCCQYHLSTAHDGIALACSCSDSSCMPCDNCICEQGILEKQAAPLWQTPPLPAM
ncbi:hypothetical protein FRC11_006804 [Ceratobasidium sp. 423]|nr:hypothetical protein FRC11_006804 [Ceratobasidium sp. 423]